MSDDSTRHDNTRPGQERLDEERLVDAVQGEGPAPTGREAEVAELQAFQASLQARLGEAPARPALRRRILADARRQLHAERASWFTLAFRLAPIATVFLLVGVWVATQPAEDLKRQEALAPAEKAIEVARSLPRAPAGVLLEEKETETEREKAARAPDPPAREGSVSPSPPAAGEPTLKAPAPTPSLDFGGETPREKPALEKRRDNAAYRASTATGGDLASFEGKKPQFEGSRAPRASDKRAVVDELVEAKGAADLLSLKGSLGGDPGGGAVFGASGGLGKGASGTGALSSGAKADRGGISPAKAKKKRAARKPAPRPRGEEQLNDSAAFRTLPQAAPPAPKAALAKDPRRQQVSAKTRSMAPELGDGLVSGDAETLGAKKMAPRKAVARSLSEEASVAEGASKASARADAFVDAPADEAPLAQKTQARGVAARGSAGTLARRQVDFDGEDAAEVELDGIAARARGAAVVESEERGEGRSSLGAPSSTIVAGGEAAGAAAPAPAHAPGAPIMDRAAPAQEPMVVSAMSTGARKQEERPALAPDQTVALESLTEDRAATAVEDRDEHEPDCAAEARRVTDASGEAERVNAAIGLARCYAAQGDKPTARRLLEAWLQDEVSETSRQRLQDALADL